MPEIFTIYVGEERIYSGPLEEIPDYYRENLVEAISEWGECLSKSGLRELIYSSLHWYNAKTYYCGACEKELDSGDGCGECGGDASEVFAHERNPEIDRIMMCIGLIDRVEMETLER